MIPASRRRRVPTAALGLSGAVSAALLLAGCAHVDDASASVHEPATVTTVPGLDVDRVALDPEAARRISLETARVRPDGDGVSVPYAALLYDGKGASWVYAELRPRTYQRAAVVVDRIEGDRARLVSGPAPGSRVVTVGATEVYGAELGISGSH